MDYLSLKAAVAEIRQKFSGSKITDAWQARKTDIVLLPRRCPGIILSIDPGKPGLFQIDQQDLPPRLPSPFTDLLRARIKGTTLGSIEIPEPGERLVTFTFAAAWPARESTPLTIVVEVMGRRSNLMVLEEGRILLPLKSVPKDKSPVRPVAAGQEYHPPPMRTGIPVDNIRVDELPVSVLEEDVTSLTEVVRGLSPYTALQAVRMATEKRPEMEQGEAVSLTLKEMVAACTGETGYLLHLGSKCFLSPFEPMLTDLSGSVKQFSPFSAAASQWKEFASSGTMENHDETTYLEKRLTERTERLLTALRHVDDEEERCRDHNEMRVMAEALLIHSSEIVPGSESVHLPDPYDPGLQLMIPMDRSKSPQENANVLFSRARRLKRGLDEAGSRRTRLSREKEDVQQALEALTERDDPEPARKILGTSPSGTLKRQKHTHPAHGGPGRKHTVNGYTILVGKSSTDNEKVTFQAAGPGDLWLHARDYPGSHVVILTEKQMVPDEVLYAAASLAAAGSGARNDSAPEIMVTERKWVRKLKGGRPGQVTVERFRTIRPRIQEPGSRNQKKK